MYAFSNSLLELFGEYRAEVYNMEIFGYEASIRIDLKIFGAGAHEAYSGEYEITREDGKTAHGCCCNRPTKEEMFVAVEEAVIRALENEDQYYWE